MGFSGLLYMGFFVYKVSLTERSGGPPGPIIHMGILVVFAFCGSVGPTCLTPAGYPSSNLPLNEQHYAVSICQCLFVFHLIVFAVLYFFNPLIVPLSLPGNIVS
jgi:hypothetical protein